MDDSVKKRVTIKPKHPNPLFEQWLTEWRDKAKENDSKMQYCFSHALTTLRKYPLPLESGKDCKILKGFGEKLCKMLDDKLKQHKAETGSNLATNTNNNVGTKPKKRKSESPANKQPKVYIPQQGSGAYAILVTLYEKNQNPDFPSYLTKNEIIQYGQHLCNVSFVNPGPDTRYTGWSSMRTLLEKRLVHKQGNTAKFSLTDEGISLADKLYIQQKIKDFQKQEEDDNLTCSTASTSSVNYCSTNKENIAAIVTEPPVKKKVPIWPSTSSSSQTSSTSIQETVLFAPNSFEIILLVDTAEIKGNKTAELQDPILRELTNLNVHFEVRNLKVGDYTWICRDNKNTELVLPYIIERKRMDDLGGSIKDDRFYEQKFRLKQSGIQNLIYLVESYGKNEHVGLPLTSLYQAAINTSVHDGFIVKYTDNGKASCEYLACLTHFLENFFKNKTLIKSSKEDLQPAALDDDLVQLMEFKEFNKSSAKSKHFKVKEMFVRQLLQISGMSVDKALAIIEKYPTPQLLRMQYNEVGEAGEKLLSNIQYGVVKKNVGPVLSKTIYQFFCKSVY